MCDVLYILGNGSKWNDNELRYSLRSLETYCKDTYKNVYLVGSCPSFINTDEVHYIPASDDSCRQLNHYDKVYKAFSESYISDDAILMYDDIFFTKPTDLSHYPYIHRGPLKPTGDTLYAESQRRAQILTEADDYTPLNYSYHGPIIYNRQKFTSMTKYFNHKLIRDGIGLDTRCMYGNLFRLGGEQRNDCKIITPPSSTSWIEKQIKDNECFSIGDPALNDIMKEFIVKTYPNKSRYEK